MPAKAHRPYDSSTAHAGDRLHARMRDEFQKTEAFMRYSDASEAANFTGVEKILSFFDRHASDNPGIYQEALDFYHRIASGPGGMSDLARQARQGTAALGRNDRSIREAYVLERIGIDLLHGLAEKTQLSSRDEYALAKLHYGTAKRLRQVGSTERGMTQDARKIFLQTAFTHITKAISLMGRQEDKRSKFAQLAYFYGVQAGISEQLDLPMDEQIPILEKEILYSSLAHEMRGLSERQLLHAWHSYNWLVTVQGRTMQEDVREKGRVLEEGLGKEWIDAL